MPVGCRLHESRGWRYDLDELESKITPKTRVLYLNSPSNPTGGVLTRADLERMAAIAREHDLWVISDEAYEDVVFDGEHVSIASLPGMYERTIPLYTFSKSYAMTGLRLGYVAIKDAGDPRSREEAAVLHRQQRRVGRPVRRHRRARRAAGLHRGVPHRAARAARPLLRGHQGARRRRLLRRAAGGRVLRVPAHQSGVDRRAGHRDDGSVSWADGGVPDQERTHRLRAGRGLRAAREGYVRFCFARDREELTGALDSMKQLFAVRA